MARPIPKTLAPLVEHLELERPPLITLEQLAGVLQELGIATTASKAAYRLRQRGWLLPTGVPGVYEFAPADRAGPISYGDALLPLRAVHMAMPELPVAATLGTALWLRNIADRGPDIPEVALATGRVVPRALQSNARIVRFEAQLPVDLLQGVPVHRPATILVHLAQHPQDVQSWGSVLEVLPDLVAAVAIEDIALELRGRPHATWVRLAYLTSGIAPQLAVALGVQPVGKVWFGPRGPLRHHDAAWNVADTVLPFPPGTLAVRVPESSSHSC